MIRPILLAEDSEDDAILIQATLRKAEVLNPVLAVSDGVQAIAYLKGHGFYADRVSFPLPAVVLLDLKMPHKNGFQVLEWWKTQPQLKDILIVVLSGYYDLESIRYAYSLGARSFLIKPCKVEDIMNLRQAFAGSWNEPATSLPPQGEMKITGSTTGRGPRN
ncbi:MAG TPA: response regulator [Verrucomicrobiae bacterium]|jgi:CheY-like chemotaxis protein|nr:response regulator [Verrucomicrobiae bacterium]